MLLLVSIAFAQTGTQSAILEWVDFFKILLIGILMFAVVVAATGYIIAQFFGAQTRAAIQVWSQSLLGAAGVSLLILIIFYALLPGFTLGVVPTDPNFFVNALEDLVDVTTQALFILIITLVILSGIAYAYGQAFGAEKRARARFWAQVLITSAIIVSFIYIVLQVVIASGQALLDIPGEYLPGPYHPILASTIVFISLIVLITYLVSKILHIPSWEAYLTIELSDLITSLLIVVLIIGLYIASGAVAGVIINDPDVDTPPAAAIGVLSGIIGDLEEIRTDSFTIQACASILSTFHKRTGESALNITFKLFPGIDLFVSIMGMLANGFIMLEASLKAQMILIQIIDVIAVPILLPAGIILRFLPPTRDAGAFILALAIGFGIIFPLTYVINENSMDEVNRITDSGGDGSGGIFAYHRPKAMIASICGFDLFFATVPYAAITTAAGFFSPVLSAGLGSALQLLLSEWALLLYKASEFVVILDAMTVISLKGFFAPSISMVFTVSFINGLTKFILMK